MSSLGERTAIVTGAGAGLGEAIAFELAKAGANIAVLDLDLVKATSVAAGLSQIGVMARPYHVDVSHSDDVDSAFDSVYEDFGRLDMVINNAGISLVGPHIQDT